MIEDKEWLEMLEEMLEKNKEALGYEGKDFCIIRKPTLGCYHQWKIDFSSPFTNTKYESCIRCGAKKEET